MDWMVPINRLDAVQMQAIDDIVSNPHRDHLVKGFAGSGKTIVLTHVIERLASAPGRKRICFATYTHALKDLVESGLSSGARKRVEIKTFDSLRRVKNPYDILIADEVQDVTKRYFTAFEGSYLHLIGAADFDQRIYRSSVDPETVRELFSAADEHELQEIHRINENVFLVATDILDDAAVHELATVREDDELTYLFAATSKRNEYSTMYEEAVRVAAKAHPSAILFPSKRLIADFIEITAALRSWGTPPPLETVDVDSRADKYGEMNRFLSQANSPLQVFGSGSGEMAASDRRPMVYLMTYHSAKGLDFPYVFLPHLTEDTKLEAMGGASDLEERRKFFVAATRAKRRLYLSYHGQPHRFIGQISPVLLTPFTKQKRTY